MFLEIIVPVLYDLHRLLVGKLSEKLVGSKTMLEKWLTLEQASTVTGYTDGYLRRMLRNGVLQGCKLNPRLWLVDKRDAEKLARKPHVNGRPRAKEPKKVGKTTILKKYST